MSEMRFIRLLIGGGGGGSVAQTTALLDNPSILGKRVPWLNRLHLFASNTLQLNLESDYQQGRVVGMDAASALAVEMLDVHPGMQVLDLCCAPGMKLIALSELMNKQGRLIGVDVSETRLFTTCAVLRKYGVCIPPSPTVATAAEDSNTWEMDLYEQDGRVFNRTNAGRLTWSVGMNHIFLNESKPLKVPRKRVSGKGLKKKLASAAKAAGEVPIPEDSLKFDRILVDAECTTDARLHKSKAAADEEEANASSAYKKTRVFTREEELETEELQFALLSNAFSLLKPGGILVYSTCSMMRGQNEDVVKRLLQATPEARLMHLPQLSELCVEETSVADSGRSDGEPKMWRLTPQVSGTSGLFLAKITKEESNN